MTVKTDQVVQAVIATRDEIALLEKQHKAKIADMKALQSKRVKWLQTQLDERGEDSVKTEHGTFFKKKSEFISVTDMDALVAYIKENEAWDLLNKAVNKSAALERMGEERDVTKVPFLKYSSEVEVQVRR